MPCSGKAGKLRHVGTVVVSVHKDWGMQTVFPRDLPGTPHAGDLAAPALHSPMVLTSHGCLCSQDKVGTTKERRGESVSNHTVLSPSEHTGLLTFLLPVYKRIVSIRHKHAPLCAQGVTLGFLSLPAGSAHHDSTVHPGLPASVPTSPWQPDGLFCLLPGTYL